MGGAGGRTWLVKHKKKEAWLPMDGTVGPGTMLVGERLQSKGGKGKNFATTVAGLA